jgi:S-disulfanyl-L-cysteine oxidoreductase SoxD
VIGKKHVVIYLGLMLSGMPYQLFAQSGIYSADQAHRGEDLYKKQCTACHGEALDGVGPYPPLSGDEFLSKYTGQPALTVYDMILKLMTAPGTLTRPQAADLLAYILSFNKFPAGKTDLPTDEEALKTLTVPKPAPKT